MHVIQLRESLDHSLVVLDRYTRSHSLETRMPSLSCIGGGSRDTAATATPGSGSSGAVVHDWTQGVVISDVEMICQVLHLLHLHHPLLLILSPSPFFDFIHSKNKSFIHHINKPIF